MTPLEKLEKILQLWREHREPALGARVIELGEKVSVALPLPSPTAKGVESKRLAWSDVVRSAKVENWSGVLPRLGEYVRTGKYAWPVVDELSSVPPDPRIGALAIDLLEGFKAIRNPSWDLWRNLCDCIDRHGDVGLVPRIAAIVASDRVGREVLRMQNVEKRLVKARRPLDMTKLAAAIGEVPDDVAQRSQPIDHGTALLEAVYADLENDDVRAVYADYLSSIGDPRGEFISLQLHGSCDERPNKRMLALQRKHQKQWLDPIWPLLRGRVVAEKNARFERGFLAHVEWLNDNANEHLLDHPLLTTLQHIEGRIDAFGRSLKNLRTVGSMSGSALRSLREQSYVLQMREVTLRWADDELARPIPQLARLVSVHHEMDHREVPGGWLGDVLEQLLAQPWPELSSIELVYDNWRAWPDHWSWHTLDQAPTNVRELRIPLFEVLGTLGKSYLDWRRIDDRRGELVLRRTAKGWSDATIRASLDGGPAVWAILLSPFQGARRLERLKIEPPLPYPTDDQLRALFKDACRALEIERAENR